MSPLPMVIASSHTPEGLVHLVNGLSSLSLEWLFASQRNIAPDTTTGFTGKKIKDVTDNIPKVPVKKDYFII